MRHIHVHLHSHPSASGASVDTLDAPLLTKAPSTTPKRPPTTVIKPQPQAPHNPPRPKGPIAPMKPAGVIKSQSTTPPHVPGVPGVKVATRTVHGVQKLLQTANRVAQGGPITSGGGR